MNTRIYALAFFSYVVMLGGCATVARNATESQAATCKATMSVILTLSPAGTIRAKGGQAVVNRWLPVIRRHKPEIVAALKDTRYTVTVDDPDTDPVLISVGIRDMATFDMAIPKAKFDPFKLMDLIDRHNVTVH